MTLATQPTAPTATTTTFELPAGVDVAACAATESNRYAMAFAQVTTGTNDVYVTCTDGRMASVVHLETPTQGPSCTALVPPSILKRATGKDRVAVSIGTQGAARTDKRGTMTLPPVEVSAPFPPIDDVMPSPESLADSVSVSLNAEYLAALAAAIGADPTHGPRITITIPRKPGKPVLVQGKHGFGLLMPLAAVTDDPVGAYMIQLQAWRNARANGGAR